jgi:hypothetical protein
MYPRNNASPPAIDLGEIVLKADGTQQTTGVSARVKIGTGAWGAAAGSLDVDATSGIWTYAPTQAETNADYFIVAAYKSACTSVSKTIITSNSATAGQVRLEGVTHTSAVIPTVTTTTTATNLTNLPAIPNNWLTAAGIADNAITDAKVASDVTIASVTGSVGSVTNAVTVGTINANVITDTSIASGAFTSAKFAAGAFDAVWTVTTRSLTTFGSLVSDIWSHATRILTAGTNIVLAKGTGVTGFNDLDAAGVRTAIGLGSANLDTQLADLPTVAEFNARSLPSADYFVVSDYTAPDNAGIAANGVAIGNVPTLAEIEASTVLAKEATVAERATQTSVDGKPTLAQIEASTVLPTKTDVQNAGLL